MKRREKKGEIACACGCGRTFEPTRSWHIFATDSCRGREGKIACVCGCGLRFKPYRKNHVFASDACRGRGHREKWLRKRPRHRAQRPLRVVETTHKVPRVQARSFGHAMATLAKANPVFILLLARRVKKRPALAEAAD